MYCKNCGTYNSQTSKFCSNCAQPLTDTAIEQSITKSEKALKEKMYSANLLNIISVALIILSMIITAYTLSTPVVGEDRYDTDGSGFANTACFLDGVVVIVGLIIYFGKNNDTKKNLSMIYTIGACIMTCVMFGAIIATFHFACGFNFTMIVAGILQIIAGTKFLSATKNA